MTEPLSACGLIFAYRLDGKGGGLALDLRACLAPDEPLLSGTHWLHFDGHHQGARLWLRGESGLDPVAIDGLLGRNPRPRVSVTGDQVLLSLRGLSMEPSSPEDDMLSVQVWTNGARIITCRDRPAQAIADLRRDIEHGHGPTDTGEFLSQLAERLVSAMDDLIAGAEIDTDRLGHTGDRGNTGALVEELAGIRRRMIRLGRYLGPQRRALTHLAASPLTWLNHDDRALLHATAEQTAEFEDSLRSALEVAEITQDELLQRSSEKTEQRVYVLTLISAVFMPLSFVTGLFGVNLAGIPAAEDTLSFATLCASLLGLVTVQLLIFKRKGWF